MKHTSVKIESPVEFINITPLNPLISQCQIKVCYVGDEPNRNRSVITKDVAKQIIVFLEVLLLDIIMKIKKILKNIIELLIYQMENLK